MPYISIIVPPIPEDHKEKFLAHFPTIAKEMKELPMVLGVSGGQILGEDHAEVKEFKFIHTIAFATLEDQKSFETSEWALSHKAKFEEAAKAAGHSTAAPPHATFEVADFPKDHTPKALTQMSRIAVADEGKLEEVRAAWEAVMAAVGKQTWGGRSVGSEDGKTYGLGFVGWDSFEASFFSFSLHSHF
ncbi:hypothetical protein BGZ60DRAFT_228172 [Tricladium varicosporioides]|nr:hypothetical protein BGZ60DRAFT_228172 [Hymenoscyphus varicosporioides]